MHRAEKTSSKLCRDRELDAAKAIHRKKLQETRSAIDTHKPRTSTMYHLLHNMKRERELEDRQDEIERHNTLLVNRMTDVLHCSAWDFHPSPASSVNTVSYTVYGSPRHSPHKPSAPAKKSLNETSRTQKLRQIHSDNLAITRRVRQSSTHYKNSRLHKDWQQSVKYLKAICAFPLLKPSPPSPREAPLPLVNPREFLRAQALDEEEDDLLEYYNLSLPTLAVPAATPPRAPVLRHKKARGFEPKRVGARPGLPVLDHMSPRFKWGPSSQFVTAAAPTPPKAPPPYLFKKGRAVDGTYLVLTVATAHTYGMTVGAYDGETCRSYELDVSKDDMLRLLRDAISVRDEFAVEAISQLLCDRLRFDASTLFLALDAPRTVAGLEQRTLFCSVQPHSVGTDRFLVTVASTDTGVRVTAVHNRSRASCSLALTFDELVQTLRSLRRVATSVEGAVSVLLPCLVVEDGIIAFRRPAPPPAPRRPVLWETERELQGQHWRWRLECDAGDLLLVATDPSDGAATMELPLHNEVETPSADALLARVTIGPNRRLQVSSPSRPSTTEHADTVLSKLAEMENDMRRFIEQHHSSARLLDAMARPDVSETIADEEEDEEEDEQIGALAATRIQAQFRGALVRRGTMELRRSLGMRVDIAPLELDKAAAATRIQAHVRGAISRQARAKDEVRPLPSFELSPSEERGLSRLQARVRGSLVRRRLHDEPMPMELFDPRAQAATQIQARFRGTLSRQLLHKAEKAGDQPAQRSFRGTLAPQRSFRGSLARRDHDHDHDEVVAVDRPLTPHHSALPRQSSRAAGLAEPTWTFQKAHMGDERLQGHRPTVFGVVLEATARGLATKRPASAVPAPVATPKSHAKIADLVTRNRPKAASSADLIKSFESAVRKVVDGKRSDADKLQYTCAKKAEDVARARLVRQDLRRECDALGITTASSDTDRLQAVASYSRRPFYSKSSNIRDLEEKLALKTTEVYAVVRKILSYEHIKRRHEAEKAALVQLQHKLTHDLWDKNHRIQELHRLEIVASDALNSTQSRLAELKAEIAREVRLFETELSHRERWLREKAKFNAFYAQQVESIPDLVGGRRSSALTNVGHHTPAGKRWSFPMVVRALEGSRHEDKRCEEAFRRLGLTGDRVNPAEIVLLCKAHDQLRDELVARQATQAEHLKRVKQRLRGVRAELQGTRSKSARRLDRDGDDLALALQRQETKLGHARDEYDYVQQIVHPVKAGIQQIVSQVTAETVNADSIKAIEAALERVERQLVGLLEDEAVDALKTTTNLVRLAAANSNLMHKQAAWTKATGITSPHNVRVKPKEEWSFPQHSAERSPTKTAGKHHRATTTLALRDVEDAADGAADDVMDRDTVKQISSTLYAMSRKKRESGQ
ncbi:hypothetical protein ACHHYP_15800 [Achlya hypogyna]|uniref:Uncharacterized protein n=1 Tax=Achlya hypogyna TaxID=1202772 RepID=A0A1V9ZET1_ACHHY|nr:hypothetical protein ACHHYP_15800 [Achlya hypogyna]